VTHSFQLHKKCYVPAKEKKNATGGTRNQAGVQKKRFFGLGSEKKEKTSIESLVYNGKGHRKKKGKNQPTPKKKVHAVLRQPRSGGGRLGVPVT